jgi:hypothetical protein
LLQAVVEVGKVVLVLTVPLGVQVEVVVHQTLLVLVYQV